MANKHPRRKSSQQSSQPKGPANSRSFTVQQQTYKGPFPPASEIQRYAQVNPEFPVIIFKEFEREAQHRRERELEEQKHKHHLENLVNEANIKEKSQENEIVKNNNELQNLATKIGLWVGSLWLALILGAAIWSIYLKADYRVTITILGIGAIPQISKILGNFKNRDKKQS